MAERPMRDHAQAAEHAVPADRCARKIVPFLKPSHSARSRQLNANPFGRSHHQPPASLPPRKQ